MARKNLVNQSVADNKETFKRFRDFLCKRNGSYDYSVLGIGWTLHDSAYAVDQHTISANDYFVAYSAGEDGNQDLYIKVVWQDATYIYIYAFLYWNNSTHAGVQSYGSNSMLEITSPTNMWVYGSMDDWALLEKAGSTYAGAHGGHCTNSPIAQAYAVAPSAISSGSNVVVAFSSVPTEWSVGKYLFVRDTANIQRVKITAISGLNVTFDSFSTAFLAGSKFCAEITYFLTTSNSWRSGYYLLIDHSGTKSTSKTWAASGDCDRPTNDPLTGKIGSRKAYVGDTSHVIGPFNDYRVAPPGLTAESLWTVDGVESWRYFYIGSYGTLLREVV